MNTGGHAFPGINKDGTLTKRELFAAMAMQALVSMSRGLDPPAEVAERSARYANALIYELGDA